MNRDLSVLTSATPDNYLSEQAIQRYSNESAFWLLRLCVEATGAPDSVLEFLHQAISRAPM